LDPVVGGNFVLTQSTGVALGVGVGVGGVSVKSHVATWALRTIK